MSLAADQFKSKFLGLIILTWMLPPMIGLSTLLYIEAFTIEQMVVVMTTPLKPAFLVVGFGLSVWYFWRYSQVWTNYLTSPSATQQASVVAAINKFSLKFWGVFLGFLLLAPAAMILSAEIYTDYVATPVDWFRVHLVALIISIIVGLPIFIMMFDLFGRTFSNIALQKPVLTIKTRIFLIGALMPLLIDSMLVQYFWTKTGYFGLDTFVIWLLLEIIAIAGTLLFVRSIQQSLNPLQALIDSPYSGNELAELPKTTPLSTDELGIFARQLNCLLQQQHYQKERLDQALQSSHTGLWEWNVVDNKHFFSQTYLDLVGCSGENCAKRESMIHPEDLVKANGLLAEHLNGKNENYDSDHRVRVEDGRYQWFNEAGKVVERDSQGNALRFIGTLRNITQQKEFEDKLLTQTYIDPLTHLPNRKLYYERLEREIARVNRNGEGLGVVFIDLDHFKEINDTLGHSYGDQLLTQVADRILSCVRKTDTLARLGGDEFTLLLTDLQANSEIEKLLQTVLDKVAAPYQLDQDHKVYLSASIGVTFYPNDGQDSETLLKNADQAMYAAKAKGRNRYHFFTESMSKTAQIRMQRINDLRTALSNNELVLHYQPIVDLQSGDISKTEALIRWQHQSGHMVMPNDFIPLAEETNMILDIGDWVFQAAAKQLAIWRENYIQDMQMGINQSPVQFHHQDHRAEQWVNKLKQLKLDGNSFVIEITEGLLLDANETVKNKLFEYRDAGINVALDDFGTGYSSLSYLTKLDIDYLKIDRSFIQNIEDSVADLTLCKAMIVMAHKLGLKVVAEGIETEQQRNLLLQAGCDFGQGYYFYKPMPAEQVDQLLQKQRLADSADVV